MCLNTSNMPPMIDDLSPKGISLKSTMKKIMYAHILLAFIKMGILNPYSSIGDLFGCLTLYCGIN